MTFQKQVYKNPQAGTPLISTISSNCKTPILRVKYSNLISPYYYNNSPTIPRYSITCVVDPIDHVTFLKGIQTIEKNEGVDSIIKNETSKQDSGYEMTGLLLVKFQGKNKIPMFILDEESKPVEIELEDELAIDERISVVYDILRYTKKNTMRVEHGLSFKPVAIYYYPSAKEE